MLVGRLPIITRSVSGLTSGTVPGLNLLPTKSQWIGSGLTFGPRDSAVLDHRCGGSAGLIEPFGSTHPTSRYLNARHYASIARASRNPGERGNVAGRQVQFK